MHGASPFATSFCGQQVSPESPSGHAYRTPRTCSLSNADRSAMTFPPTSLSGAGRQREMALLGGSRPIIGDDHRGADTKLRTLLVTMPERGNEGGGFQPGPVSQYQNVSPGLKCGSQGHEFGGSHLTV